MIVSFSVSNFRSFWREETLSLVASSRLLGSHDEHAIPIPASKEKVLRAAVLYGANGSGKSNLFKALRYFRTMALRPRPKNTGTGRKAFRFGAGAKEPSTFDLLFAAAGKLYRLALKVDDQRVTEEWLAEMYGARERTVYERTTDEDGKVNIRAPGLKRCGKKLDALATVGGPQNQSFLATINATLDAADRCAELNAVLAWLDELTLIAPEASFVPLGQVLAHDASFKRFASEFLKSSSTGIDRLKVLKEEITEEELRRLLPDKFVGEVLRDITEEGGLVVDLDEDSELLIERKGENRFYRITIQSVHKQAKGKATPLDFADESDGTRRLLNLMPALHHLRSSRAVYFIDEIDRSLHPILIWQFLQFFLKSCEGGQRQIIVTTHESHLLDLALLRRDEIWFVEKDQTAQTRLYSLSDFKVRKDLEIRKHYLQGRFGAVPFLGNTDSLLASRECPE